MKLHSLVLPTYNEQEIIDRTFTRLVTVFPNTARDSYEFIFVNDGSRDQTPALLDAIQKRDSRVRIIHLSRNFGHQIALSAGLKEARGDTVSVLDADLQDPPELVMQFIAQWNLGYQVVYGIRKNRSGENWFKLTTAKLFYRFISRLAKVELPLNVGDFRLMDRKVVDAYNELREKHRYFRGLVAWLGFKQVGIFYEREARLLGKTKYTFPKMLQFATDGITSFTVWPLKLATYFGFFTAFASILAIGYVAHGKIMHNTVDGWASVMVIILLLGSIQFFTIGMIGEYLGRMFDEVRGRPLYVIDRKLGFSEPDPNK